MASAFPKSDKLWIWVRNQPLHQKKKKKKKGKATYQSPLLDPVESESFEH